MVSYRCKICEYIYDEDIGDLDSGIDPGTKWEDIDNNWVCKNCGSKKSDEDWERVEEDCDDGFGSLDDEDFEYEDEDDED